MREKIAEIVKEAVNYTQPCHSCPEYPCKKTTIKCATARLEALFNAETAEMREALQEARPYIVHEAIMFPLATHPRELLEQIDTTLGRK